MVSIKAAHVHVHMCLYVVAKYLYPNATCRILFFFFFFFGTDTIFWCTHSLLLIQPAKGELGCRWAASDRDLTCVGCARAGVCRGPTWEELWRWRSLENVLQVTHLMRTASTGHEGGAWANVYRRGSPTLIYAAAASLVLLQCSADSLSTGTSSCACWSLIHTTRSKYFNYFYLDFFFF